jgi:meso-butanediol dehydrogenase/(S,S)-butanediol dehydrogenase/diacetyl reductase
MYESLKGKVAIVTGAGRAKGLGEAMAKRLAAEGAKVIVHDLGTVGDRFAPVHGIGTVSEVEARVAEIRAAGGTAEAFTGDLRKEADVEALVAFAVETYGRLDILINNAGVGYLFGPLVEMAEEEWDTVLDVNLRGCFFGMKHAARQMIAQGEGGRIISIASLAGKSAVLYTSAYTASKHGLIGLTRTAALELGPHGITVNAICPNHVTTGLGAWQNDFSSGAKSQSLDEYMAEMTAGVPLGRVGLPDDTAKAAAFLCSDEGSYITGEAMNVSGGEEYH